MSSESAFVQAGETTEKKSIRLPHLLLVEGTEEEQFWKAFLQRRCNRSDVQVMSYDGKDNFRNTLRVLQNDHNFDSVRWLGVARDGDQDPLAAFQSVCGTLHDVKLPAPSNSWQKTETSPSVVIFVLPDGTSYGDLEALVLQAIANQPQRPCIDSYFECLTEAGLPPPTNQRFKARILAYFASLARPEGRIGIVAQRGDLPLDNIVFDRFVTLLPSV